MFLGPFRRSPSSQPAVSLPIMEGFSPIRCRHRRSAWSHEWDPGERRIAKIRCAGRWAQRPEPLMISRYAASRVVAFPELNCPFLQFFSHPWCSFLVCRTALPRGRSNIPRTRWITPPPTMLLGTPNRRDHQNCHLTRDKASTRSLLVHLVTYFFINPSAVIFSKLRNVTNVCSCLVLVPRSVQFFIEP